MKHIVFFFVNPDQIVELSNKRLSKQLLPNQTDYKVISVTGIETFKVGASNLLDDSFLRDRNMFILKDISPVKSTLSILQSIDDPALNVYAVFHKNADNSGALATTFLSELGGQFKTYLTESEIGGSTYDKYLIPLAEKFSADLFDELLTKFPDKILSEKLSLLHDCLVPSGVPQCLPDPLLNAESGEYYKAAYGEFLDVAKEKADDNIFESDYIDALKKLRKAFLGS